MDNPGSFIESNTYGTPLVEALNNQIEYLTDKRILVTYYKSATYGLIIYWFDSGMKKSALDDYKRLEELKKGMAKEMFERAKAHRDAHTYEATDYEEFKDIVANKPGFVKAMWCGDVECENKIKEELAVTSRCMPFEQETISDKCVCCGKPAKKMVYWGRAY